MLLHVGKNTVQSFADSDSADEQPRLAEVQSDTFQERTLCALDVRN